jgi:DNA (cytosine-5)-methyltransferase 1
MIKLFEMFAGYGGASFALKRIGIEHEVVGYSEIDKYAIQCYEQNHKGKNFGDCTKINPNELPDFDLLTGGFPCQSFSVAGKGLGEQDTRGTLFHEIIRIAEIKKPKMMLLENVKGLTNKPHRDTFNKILSELDRIGYVVKWKVLNSKDYGIPQNRERVFFVCFLKGMDTMKFSYPKKEELNIFIKDILEENVDEKYFLNNEQVTRLLSKFRGFNERTIKEGVSPTLCSRDYKDPKVVGIYQIGNEEQNERPCYIQIDKGNHSQQDRYYSIENVSPTIVRNIPKILDCYNKKVKEDVCPTLTEPHHNNLRLLINFRIRKLTPKECFRLMGFLDDGINIEGLSDTQKYKLAGNGWDINLVSKIFQKMFNVIAPHTNFPTEFSYGKRHNIGLKKSVLADSQISSNDETSLNNNIKSDLKKQKSK